MATKLALFALLLICSAWAGPIIEINVTQNATVNNTVPTSITGRLNFATKVESGMNGSIYPIGSPYMFPDGTTKSLYFLNTTGSTFPLLNYRMGLGSVIPQLTRGSILNATAYSITATRTFSNRTSQGNVERIEYTRGPETNLGSGAYLLEITTTPDAAGLFSWSLNGNTFDPAVIACGHLASSGIYTLSVDLVDPGSDFYCITFDRGDTTLDCAGHSISNAAVFDSSAISLGGGANQIVKNCVIRDYTGIGEVGIEASAISNVLITNTTFNNTNIGVSGDPLDTVSINYSRFLNLATGISASEVFNSNFSYNNFTNTSTGMYISGSVGGVWFDGNQMTNISQYGFNFAGDENGYIDCQGKSMKGNNASNSVGIYDVFFVSEIRGCNISNFDVGIYLINAAATITNTNVSSTRNNHIDPTYDTGILSYGGSASSAILINVSVTSTFGPAFFAYLDAGGNAIYNSSFTSSSDKAFYCISSTSMTVKGVNATSKTGQGFYLQSCADSSLNRVIGISNSSRGITLNGNNRTVISNSTFSSNTNNAVQIASSVNNTIVNNTFFSNSTMLQVEGASGRNSFYLNNFTNGPGVFVNDTNGTNFYNATFNGKNQGNAYGNVLNGTVSILGGTLSDIPPYYIGTTGLGYPYNNSTSFGQFVCSFTGCADFAPLTPSQTQTANLTVTCSAGALTCTGNDSNFIIPANKSIATTAASGFAFSNWTVTSGTCTVISATNASTSAQFLGVTNCSIFGNFTVVPPSGGGGGGSILPTNTSGNQTQTPPATQPEFINLVELIYQSLKSLIIFGLGVASAFLKIGWNWLQGSMLGVSNIIWGIFFLVLGALLSSKR